LEFKVRSALAVLVCASVLLVPLCAAGVIAARDLDRQEDGPLRAWTIGMYWGGDNNLDGDTETFIDLWMEYLDTDQVALGVFIDRLELPTNVSTLTEDGWTERYTPGEVNSSDPQVLADFIEFLMTDPMLDAENYMLVVQDHGLGYLGIVADDSEPNGKAWMSIDGLGRALDMAYEATGEKLDIIDLDACSMATVEVAYELRGKASYLVASQLAVPFDGLNYMALLQGLSVDPTISPLDLARKMVDDYGEWYSAPLGTYPTLYPYMQDFATLSAIDLSKIEAVGDAFGALVDALLPKVKDFANPLNTAAQHYFVAMWENNMGCGFTADVRGMFGEVATLIRDAHPTVAALCDDVVSSASEAIVKEWASWRFRDRPSGMSVFTPSSIGIYNVNWDALDRVYGEIGLDFAEDSGWDEVLLTYFCTMKQLGAA
jgi:hypothetical protein